MKAILNHNIIDLEEIKLSPSNRGFRFGDGFFETIAIIRGKPRFLDRHIGRLKKAGELLKLETGEILNSDKIESDIESLKKSNNLFGNARLRLYIWRNTDGLYTPTDGQTDMLMTIENMRFHKITMINEAGFSGMVKNYPTPFSRFKTLSAMKYVLAGIEKKDKDLDDIILIDCRGYVSESLSSNIFWKKNNRYLTPPLSTGCIEGIMRNWLMSEFKLKGYSVEEKLAEIDELLDAECIFTSNALGVKHIRNIGDCSFSMDPVSQQIIDTVS